MHAPVSDFVDLDGVRLEVSRTGPASSQRPTIVLLHEGLGCVSMWRDFPQRLNEATGLDVLTYSRRGYGRSDPVPLPRPLSYMHDEALDVLPKLMDRLAIGPAILVGHSDGASIAAINAGGVRDPRVLGTVLMAPHFFNEDLCVRTIRDALDKYENGDLRARLARHHGDNVDGAFHGWNGAWLDPDFRAWNIEEFLPTIPVPVLLLWGANDPYGTIAQAEAAQIGCGSTIDVHIMTESTHWPFREEPERSLELIACFIATLTPDIQ